MGDDGGVKRAMCWWLRHQWTYILSVRGAYEQCSRCGACRNLRGRDLVNEGRARARRSPRHSPDRS